MRTPSNGGFEAKGASFVPLGGLPCSHHTRRKVLHVTPSSYNHCRTDPIEQRLDAETPEMLEPDDQIEVARRVSCCAQDLAAVMALIPGVRVVMLASSAAVKDVERAREGPASGHECKDVEGGTVAGEVLRLRSSTWVPPTRPWAA